MRISIFGSGYVGLVTGACFAESGIDVCIYDIDKDKIETLCRGKPHFFEPGLQELVQRNLEEKRLSFTNSVEEALSGVEAIFLCVGTPKSPDGSADMTQIEHALDNIVATLAKTPPIVIKSTVPIGTALWVQNYLSERGREAVIVSNPEFLKEGAAIEDCQKPDRIVVGTDDLETRNLMAALYSPFLRTGKPLLFMSNKSAEMTKYAANGMLACRISYMNEIAQLCEEYGADVEEVRNGIGSDARIGRQFLFAGLGYGGSCFPKDVSALLCQAEGTQGTQLSILRAVDNANKFQQDFFVNKISKHFNKDLKNKKFAVWGLSFKPKTDDVRESPAISVISKLLDQGCSISAFDPQAQKTAKKILGDRIEYAKDMYACCVEADGLLLCTEWEIFRSPQFAKLRELLKNCLIFDGRNQYEPKKMEQLGFVYYSLGRATV